MLGSCRIVSILEQRRRDLLHLRLTGEHPFVWWCRSTCFSSIVEARFQITVVCDERIAVIANPSQLLLHFVRVHPSARATFRCPPWPLYLSHQMMCALFIQKTSSTTEIASSTRCS